MPSNDGGLGDHLVGDKIPVGERNLQVVKLLGEGECSIGMLTLSFKKKVDKFRFALLIRRIFLCVSRGFS